MPSLRRWARQRAKSWPLSEMQLVRPASGPTATAAHRRQGIDQLLEHYRVMPIGARDTEDQRDALAVRDDVALAAKLAPVRRVEAGVMARGGWPRWPHPCGRLKSSLPAPRNLSSNSRCKRCHTPAACESRRRRQQVIPLPKPSSWGGSSQGMPVRRTNRMPFRAISSLTRGRLPLAKAVTTRNSSAVFLNSAALTSLFLFRPMQRQTPIRHLTMTWFC